MSARKRDCKRKRTRTSQGASLLAVSQALLPFLDSQALRLTCRAWAGAWRKFPSALTVSTLDDPHRLDHHQDRLWLLERLHVSEADKGTFDALACRLLSRLAFLQVLDVRSCPGFTDCALTCLGYSRSLRDLSVRACPVTDVGLSGLSSVGSLRRVSVVGCARAKGRGWQVPRQVRSLRVPAGLLESCCRDGCVELASLSLWSLDNQTAPCIFSACKESLRHLTLVCGLGVFFQYPDLTGFKCLEQLVLVGGRARSEWLPRNTRLHRVRVIVSEDKHRFDVCAFECEFLPREAHCLFNVAE
jgi:hypothetical protein